MYGNSRDKCSMYYYVCLHRNTVLYLPKDITLNFHRSGATSTIYIVTTSDNSAVGDYTCMVTVSTVESSESPAYSLSATGIVVVVMFVKMLQKIRTVRYKFSI